MKVAYFFADLGNEDGKEQRWLAAASIASVRRHMPKVEIVHLADMKTRTLDGVDSMLAFNWTKGTNRADLHAQLTGEVLYLDTDTILMRDVEDVFLQEFDVAVAQRGQDWRDHSRAYNQGVVFSRNDKFWVALAEKARQLNKYDEETFSTVAKTGGFHVIELSQSYNFTPPSDLAVLHFKGARKRMMFYV